MAEARPIAEARQVSGHRILAWCEPPESAAGWAELYWTGGGWWWVHDHPYPNACPLPRFFVETLPPPGSRK